MYADLAPRRGLFASFSPYNRRSQERWMGCLKTCQVFAVVCVLYYVLTLVFSILASPRALPFRPCLPDVAPDAPLLERVRRAQTADAPMACSTQWQATGQPCVCCVGDHCWRGAKIVANGTQMATMVDVVADGRRLRRRLPRTMNVCYRELDSEKDRCRLEENERVGDVLRAIEFLRGWPPSGQDVTPAPS
jgi:hypothetical protein